jgi:hypothetical protein
MAPLRSAGISFLPGTGASPSGSSLPGASAGGPRPDRHRVVRPSGARAGYDGRRRRPDAGTGSPSAGDRSILVAAEERAGYVTTAEVAGQVDAVVAAVREVDLDELDDEALKAWARNLQRGVDGLRAAQMATIGVMESRALREAGPGREQRALKPVRDFGRDDLNLTNSEAKKLGETGRRLQEAPEAARGLAQGRLRPEHATIITDTLRHLEGDERERVERALVEAAGGLDPVGLGKLARRLLAETDQAAAMKAGQRRHARRSGKVSLDPDGMTFVGLRLAGTDGELAHTVMHAFRRPDAPGESRTPEQACADAFVQAFEAALRSREAPTQHGERPHVTITIAADDAAAGTGVGTGQFTGPIPATEVLWMARDAKVTFIHLDPVGVPVNVSEGRKNIATSLWRALLVRDGRCRWPGCDAPPNWCDVAHAEVPDRDGGPAVLGNTALLCRRHHRKVDLGGWTMRIRGPDVIFDPPDGSHHEQLISSRTAA